MSTRTTNYGLYKPDPTDNFGDFLSEFNDNMDEIDNNLGGGGGSGGHTIVNPSGTDMPAEGKLQFKGGVTVTDDSVNGKTVVDISGGGGNVYGAFIDTNRIIQAQTAIPANTTATYTATEDCYLLAILRKDGDNASLVYVDGEQIGGIYTSTGYTTDLQGFFIKKGQVVTITVTSESHYTVYGITQGTNGIFTPIIYSDTERVVGVWRDNKPLYAKTWVLTIPNASGTYSFNEATPNLENVVHTEYSLGGLGEHGNTPWYTPATILFSEQTASHIEFYFESSYYAGHKIYFTSYYTKTTDVAGSGNWNTDGVPTVHYSTSEQVIGTFFDKPLYQKSWDLASGIPVSYNGWTGTSIDSTTMESIVSVNATHPDGTCYEGIMADPTRQSHTVVGLQTTRNGNDARIQYLTLQYTKVTD